MPGVYLLFRAEIILNTTYLKAHLLLKYLVKLGPASIHQNNKLDMLCDFCSSVRGSTANISVTSAKESF